MNARTSDRFEPLRGAIRETLAAAPGVRAFRRLPGSAEALIALAAAPLVRRPVIVITEGPHALEAVHQDLSALAAAFPEVCAPPPPLLFFPALESLRDDAELELEIPGARWNTLLRLRAAIAADEAVVLTTCVQALQQPAPDPALLASLARTLRCGDDADPEALLADLARVGYEPVPEVQAKGQVTRKGGLLDVWPANDVWPARLEFVGTQLESIRTFDPNTQRSHARPEQVSVAPITLPADAAPPPNPAAVIAGLPPGSLLLWTDYDAAAEHAERFTERLASEGPGVEAGVAAWAELQAACAARPDLADWRFELAPATAATLCDFAPLPPELTQPAEALLPDVLAEGRRRRRACVEAELASGAQVWVFFEAAGTEKHLWDPLESTCRHASLSIL